MKWMKTLQKVKGVVQGRIPGQLIVQLTNRCNAKCPQCGMRVSSRFERSDLNVDELKRMIDAAASRGFQAISFTGGEPLLRLKELTDLIVYAGAAGIPFIRTGTNGYVFMRHDSSSYMDRIKLLADTLAATPLRNFWISIDSAQPETHEDMRGLPGVTEGIRKALPEFHSRGLYPAANLGINRNLGGEPLPVLREMDACHGAFKSELEAGLRRFFQHVIDLGFSMVNTCYPMSDDTMEEQKNLEPVYAATSADQVVRFSKRERALLFTSMHKIVPEFRSGIRIFSPLTSLFALAPFYKRGAETPYPCRGGIDFFFVDADSGDTYPCG